MFSQPRSKIDLSRFMNEGTILLADLSQLDSENKQLIGSLLLKLILNAGLRRSLQKQQIRTPYSVFADEAHLFIEGDGIEKTINEARKFKIRLTLAHQFMAQFNSRKANAIGTTGITIVGRVNKEDSRFFTKHMRDLVDDKDFLGLEKYEFIGRIGTQVVRFNSLPLFEGDSEKASGIISKSHADYYEPASVLRQRMKATRTNSEKAPKTRIDLSAFAFTEEDFRYEEF